MVKGLSPLSAILPNQVRVQMARVALLSVAYLSALAAFTLAYVSLPF